MCTIIIVKYTFTRDLTPAGEEVDFESHATRNLDPDYTMFIAGNS